MENRNVKLLAALVFSTLLVGLTLHTLARSSEAARPAQSDPPGEWRVASINEPFVAIEMLSRTDGWAAAGNHFYHYNGAGWRLTVALEDADIHDFDLVSPNEGWAVGELPSMGGTASDGALWHYDGTAWQAATSPTIFPMRSIDMLSPDEGWAIGDRGISLHYDGASWETIYLSTTQSGGSTLPVPIQGYDVDAVSSDDVWMVGDYGGGVIYHYDGIAWQEVANPVTDTLTGISMLSSTEGWAVGGEEGYGRWSSVILHYDGGQWLSVTSPITMPLYAVHVVSETEGWASSENEILRYDGTSWQIFTDTVGFSDLSMLSTTEGWAVNKQGQVLHFSEENWRDRSELLDPGSVTSLRLYDVEVISDTEAWALGAGGEIFRYEGARRWTKVSSPVTLTLGDIDMISETNGWGVGADGMIAHYDGTDWQAVSSPVTNSLDAVDMISPTEGWAVGGEFVNQGYSFYFQSAILHYDGTDWMTVTNPVEGALLNDVDVISPTEGWAVGNDFSDGIMLHYDGGSWITATIPPTVSYLSAIDMVSETNGWAVGDGRDHAAILRYDGSTWESVSTDHLGLEWPYLSDIHMVSEAEGWIVGSDYTVGDEAVILYYDSTSWERVSNLLFADLDAISMSGRDTGWIVGKDGLILRLVPPLADLAITDMRMEPATPLVDEPITLTVDVENQGQGQTWIWSDPEAAWFAVEVYAKRSGGASDNPFDHQGGSDGDRWEYTAYPAGLAPGEEETLTFQIVLTETGTYSLYAQADVSWEGLEPPWGMAFGVIDEADELNNVYAFGTVELYSSEVFLPLVLRAP